MQSDREFTQEERRLIELAAKAVELPECGWMGGTYCYVKDNTFTFWDPLTDDGDALRLAVKLAIDVLQRFVGGRRTEALAPGGPVIAEWHEVHGGDADAATRRAITRAAAQLAQAQSVATQPKEQ